MKLKGEETAAPRSSLPSGIGDMTQDEMALALDALALEYGVSSDVVPVLEFAHPHAEEETRENIVTSVRAACAQAAEAMQIVRAILARSIDRVRPPETSPDELLLKSVAASRARSGGAWAHH